MVVIPHRHGQHHRLGERVAKLLGIGLFGNDLGNTQSVLDIHPLDLGQGIVGTRHEPSHDRQPARRVDDVPPARAVEAAPERDGIFIAALDGSVAPIIAFACALAAGST